VCFDNSGRIKRNDIELLIEGHLFCSQCKDPLVPCLDQTETAMLECSLATCLTCTVLHVSLPPFNFLTLAHCLCPPQPLPQDAHERIMLPPALIALHFPLYLPFPFSLTYISSRMPSHLCRLVSQYLHSWICCPPYATLDST
jgi:hypothetical protein